MMKAVAYLRVSGHKQIGGSGFERQVERIKQYCTTANMEIEKI